MALVNYGSMPGGGYQATASDTPGYGLGVGGGPDMSWMWEAARRRAAQKLHLGDLESAAAEQALRRANARPAFAGALKGPDPMERQMKELALQDAVAQTQARTRPAPLESVAGYAGHTVGHLQANPNQMNYYQRQAFLPQSNVMRESDPMDQFQKRMDAVYDTDRKVRNSSLGGIG